MHDETLAIHGGYTPDSTRAVAVPIYQTVAHDFIDADHAGGIMDLEIPGYHYNRLNNPTVDVLEQRITALEGGAAAMAVSSGAAAVSMSVLNLVGAGDNFVSVPQLYGATYTYFAHVLPTLGVDVRFAPDDRPESIGALIDGRTKAVYCETVGNPAGNVIDLAAVAEIAHAAGVPVIADNTVATPFLLKPFRHGADIVIHSLTKFIGGHGTTMGGMVIDGGTFPWAEHPDRFGALLGPEPAFHGVSYTDDFPHAPYITRCKTVGLRNTGAILSPFNAFLHLQGLETLAVRLPRHEANTRAVAAYLEQDPRVSWVSFLGIARQSVSRSGSPLPRRSRALDHDLRCPRRTRCWHRGVQQRQPVQAAAQHGRRQVADHPSGIHDAPAAQAARAGARRHHPRHGALVDRARAPRRPDRGSRTGARGSGLDGFPIPRVALAVLASPKRVAQGDGQDGRRPHYDGSTPQTWTLAGSAKQGFRRRTRRDPQTRECDSWATGCSD